MKAKLSFLEYVKIYFTFFKIGAVTFGGGLAMLPILTSELVTKRSWTTNEQLLDYYAVSQSLPGIIAVNVSTLIGYNRAGVVAGIVSAFGVVTPSIIVISFLARFIANFSDIVWVQKALMGINVGVAAMLTKSVWEFAKKSVKNVWCFLILIAAFSAIYFLKINSIWVILTSAVLGIVMSWLPAQLKAKKIKGELDKNR